MKTKKATRKATTSRSKRPNTPRLYPFVMFEFDRDTGAVTQHEVLMRARAADADSQRIAN
jgi:hypothetical protein